MIRLRRPIVIGLIKLIIVVRLNLQLRLYFVPKFGLFPNPNWAEIIEIIRIIGFSLPNRNYRHQ